MWDLIVSLPDHCLSFYFTLLSKGPMRGQFVFLTKIRAFYRRFLFQVLFPQAQSLISFK